MHKSLTSILDVLKTNGYLKLSILVCAGHA